MQQVDPNSGRSIELWHQLRERRRGLLEFAPSTIRMYVSGRRDTRKIGLEWHLPPLAYLQMSDDVAAEPSTSSVASLRKSCNAFCRLA